MGKDYIRTHEVRMQEAQQMNLLSDTFMSIVFKDLLACQYVLRKLTGIPDLVVKQVRTQYRTSKLFSRDAILDILAEDSRGCVYTIYINAEVDDGSEIADLMNYFKTADPNNMSQGDLSKRVHFLKCEEEGIKSMYEITERWLQDGIEIGIEQGILLEKQEIARRMAGEGMSVHSISKIVQTDKKVVKLWLGNEYKNRRKNLRRVRKE